MRVRTFLAILFLLPCLLAPPLAAQPAAVVPATPAVPAAAPTPDQLKAVVHTLQDDQARAKLVEQLQVLIAAQQPDAAPKEELPSTIGSRLLAGAAAHLDAARHEVAGLFNVFASLPDAVVWVTGQASDPSARERWLVFAIEMILIVVAGGVAAGAAERLLARPQRLIAQRAPASLGLKLPFLGLRTLLKLLPVAAFAAAAYLVLGISDLPRVRLAALAVVNASILVRLLLVVVEVLIDPRAKTLRLAPLGDEGAALAHRWTRRFVTVAVYGYFLIEASFVLGLPLVAYVLAMQLLGFALTVMLVRLIHRCREPVAEWLRATPLSGNGEPHPEEPHSVIDNSRAAMQQARRRLADVWHVIASVYVIAVFFVWSLNVYGGFEYLAEATLETIVVVAVARLVVNAALALLGRTVDAAALGVRLPRIEERVTRYRPLAVRSVKAVVWLVAGLMILDAWGVSIGAWLAGPIGQRVLSSGVTIAAVLVIAVFAWEAVSVLIEVLLADASGRDSRTGRSARARTLLPLFRNALLVVLVTVVSLITLSELGINTAPLLAGAGVVGVAVGFGSQTLVKDVITGLFILFEDTIAVGDVVDVGGGHSGAVEAMSIRTIRLRDTAGAVHSVPFSAVTTITNMTKDFSFAVFDVQVSYSEDPDRVSDVMKELGHDLQHDPAFRREILAPLEVMGLDRLADSGIVIKARFKTRPLQQWSVAREYNRRLLKRFNELGISIPYPHMQLVAPAAAPAVTDLTGV